MRSAVQIFHRGRIAQKRRPAQARYFGFFDGFNNDLELVRAKATRQVHCLGLSTVESIAAFHQRTQL
jgi:hypothetical protein